jgi:F0F1-type ATP synthase membrane subunit b/b'
MYISIKIIFIFLVLVILALGLSLARILELYQKIFKRYYLLKERGFAPRARKKAKEILEESQNRAVKIIGKAEIFSKETEEKLSQEAKKELLKAVNKEIKEFSRTLRKEEEKAVRQLRQKAEEEITAYKNQRLEEVESGINKMLKEVAEKVIGKSLSVKEHQDLITKALEEAKRKNVI